MIRLHHQPKAKLSKVQRFITRRPLLAYAACLLAAALAAAIAGLASRSAALPDPFTAAQRQSVAFQLYYPARLPDGYRLLPPQSQNNQNQNQMSQNGSGIISLQITYTVSQAAAQQSQQQKIDLSQQKLPPGFDLQALHSSLAGMRQYKSRWGLVSAGSINNGQTMLATLVTPDGTLLLMQAPSNLPFDDMRHIFSGLRQSGRR